MQTITITYDHGDSGGMTDLSHVSLKIPRDTMLQIRPRDTANGNPQRTITSGRRPITPAVKSYSVLTNPTEYPGHTSVNHAHLHTLADTFCSKCQKASSQLARPLLIPLKVIPNVCTPTSEYLLTARELVPGAHTSIPCGRSL